MVQFKRTFLGFYASLCIANAQNLHDNSMQCDCYVTDGNSSAYFLYHRFFDFRNIPKADGAYSNEPPNVTSSQDAGDELAQGAYLNSATFTNDWSLQTWGRGASPTSPVRMQNTKQNIYIQTDKKVDSNTTHLTLRAYRNQKLSSTAEMESLQRNLFHASIRIRARVYGAPGAVIGMFTYLNDSTESDIEILTRDPINHIRCTNQPSTGPDGYTIKRASTDVTLPRHAVWTDWNTYRIDWLPDLSWWYVNKDPVLNKAYGVPKLPSYLDINVWSDGSDWSGNMSVGSAAYLEIQWIDMVFNTSGPIDGYTLDTNEKRNLAQRSSNCKKVCIIDGIKRIGHPVMVSKASTTAKIYPVFAYGIGFLAAAMSGM